VRNEITQNDELVK
jgi:cullin 3